MLFIWKPETVAKIDRVFSIIKPFVIWTTAGCGVALLLFGLFLGSGMVIALALAFLCISWTDRKYFVRKFLRHRRGVGTAKEEIEEPVSRDR
jgi:hypothetical protein